MSYDPAIRTAEIIAEVNAKYQPQWDALMAKLAAKTQKRTCK